ncbi:1-aminocyclopropane-1-carboxylate deaminase/D-cysteine desulfhydrase [Psychroserpens sp. XS_ASV72]|uniref:1-aminocyclopropane-1-carboxylate deaminase/D-cysteine desulfhydrase n=1 Tax=Psychroserpens sp. XS_ASV72 TaxID=3241293 RepID=UPI0035110348
MGKNRLQLENHLFILPDYLNHPFISGNKLRKLKYNVLEAKKQKKETLLTFGGAYSNHIAAVAYAGKEYGFKTVGVIRGEELADSISQNPTLTFAQNCGMEFKFVSREQYRNKNNPLFLNQLKEAFHNIYVLPEGGTNALAVKGCEEILEEADAKFDYICCPVGTGGTISGLINSSFKHQKIIGFPALKGDFLNKEITKFAAKTNWELNLDYHFGGYAKVTDALIAFINTFKLQYNIPLDPIYTGKMMFGICDMIQKGYFDENAKILAVHTGGLQGIAGMNTVLKQQNKPLIV